MADMEETKHAWLWVGGSLFAIVLILVLWGVAPTHQGIVAGQEVEAAASTTATR